MFVPGVRAFFFEPFDDIAKCGVIVELFATALAEEDDDGHTPKALARDAPVRAFFDHFVNAVFAPTRNPFDVMDLSEGFRTQRFFAVGRNRVHADEPLLGRAKDHWIVAAPAMWIAVLIRMMAEQRATIGEKFHNDWIGCEDVLAFIFGQTFRVDTLVVKRRINFKAIFLTGTKVIDAVTRRSVNDAAALIERDVVREHARHLNRHKGMLEFHSFEISPFVHRENFCLLYLAFGLQRSDPIDSQQQLALFRLHNRILVVRMKGECAIMRDGPRSGGPDDGGDIAANFCSFVLATADHRKFHPDGRAHVIFIFDFGFCERG